MLIKSYIFILITNLILIFSSLEIFASKPEINDEKCNLTQNNPFIPPDFTSNTNPESELNGPQSNWKSGDGVLNKYLEFKSVAVIDEIKYFSIFNKRTNKSFWYTENSAKDSYIVKSFDKENNSLIITDGINTDILNMVAADNKPLNVILDIIDPEQNKQVVALPPADNQNQNENKQTIPRRRIVPAKK